MERIEEKFKLELVKEAPEEVKNRLEKGDMLLRAHTLNTDFLPEKWLKVLAEDSFNQRLNWRHKDPELGGRFYGRNIGNKIVNVNGKPTIDTYYRVFGGEKGTYFDVMQKYINLKMKENDPPGISKGFIVNRDKNGDITRVFALEDSITYKPKCKNCLTTEVYQMEEDNKQEIKKLQDELDSAKLQLEEKDSKISEMVEKVKKFETIVEAKEEEKKTLEDKLIELSNNVKKLEQTLIEKERAPYVETLEKLEKEKGSMLVFSIMKDRPIAKIKERIEELRNEEDNVKVRTQTLAEEAEEHVSNEGEEEELGMEVFRNNPVLAKEIMETNKDRAPGAWY